MNGGGFGAMWGWLKYHVKWKHVQYSRGSILSRTVLVGVIASMLGVVVFLADTWLHITTKTINFVQLSPVATSSSYYSLGLTPNCTTSNNSYWAQAQGVLHSGLGFCSSRDSATATFFINATQSLQVLNDTSDLTTILTYENSTPYIYYLGVPQDQIPPEYDYTATTFGMQTQCKTVSNECNLNSNSGSSTPFYCADAFQGDLTQGPSWQTAYFTDSRMTSNDTIYGIQNPYYFAIAAAESNGLGSVGLLSETPPPEIISLVHGGIGFILFCSATLYDIEYDSINGTAKRFITLVSNDSVANVWQGPISTIFGDPSAPTLSQAAYLALFSNTAQELANKVALAYSRTALALGAQAVQRTPALAVQERQSFLVSRVSAAPLFTLVTANLFFVLFGIVLTGVALKTSGGDVREVQARLSIMGLVADRFEGQRGIDGVKNMDEYFEEKEGNDSMRVAIDRSNGAGFAYKVWHRTG